MATEEKLVWSNLAVHPGETLAEEIGFRGILAGELAAQSGLSEQLLNQIVRGEKPITPDVADGLATSLEIPADFWMNLQSKYDATISRTRSTAGVLRDPGSEWDE